MKTYRSTFEENFKAIPEPCGNRRGYKVRYVYIGLWYVWNLPQERVQTAKRLIGAACVFSILIFFAGGLVSSPLNYARYVQLFGMLSMAAMVFEIFGTAQFCAAKEKMPKPDFNDIRTKMLLAPLAHAVLLFCAVIAAVWEMVGGGLGALDALVPLCYLLSGVLSLAMFLYVRSLPYRTEKNKDADIGLSSGDKEADNPQRS